MLVTKESPGGKVAIGDQGESRMRGSIGDQGEGEVPIGDQGEPRRRGC